MLLTGKAGSAEGHHNMKHIAYEFAKFATAIAAIAVFGLFCLVV